MDFITYSQGIENKEKITSAKFFNYQIPLPLPSQNFG